MKKIVVFLCVAGLALMFLSAMSPAYMKSKGNSNQQKKATGCGYRIIEFGVGVNCNGDTVRLNKSKGFQQLAAQEEVSLPGV